MNPNTALQQTILLLLRGLALPPELQSYEREARETIIQREFDRAMRAGLTINGITLRADPESLSLFTGLAAFLALGLSTQAIATETPQTLYSADGTPVTAPASQVAALLLAYGAAYAAAFGAMKSAIAALYRTTLTAPRERMNALADLD